MVGKVLIVLAIFALAVPLIGIGAASGLLVAIGMAVTVEQGVVKSQHTHENALPVLATKKLLGGTMCFIGATGFASDVVTSAIGFGGIVKTTVDNTGGADGALSVEVYEDGRFLLTGAGFAQADLKQKVYASDNYTITKTSTGNVLIGTIDEFVSATQVWVMLDKQAA